MNRIQKIGYTFLFHLHAIYQGMTSIRGNSAKQLIPVPCYWAMIPEYCLFRESGR